MVLSEQEKKERHRASVVKSRNKTDELAKKGNKRAQEQKARNRYNTAHSHARSFVKIATIDDLRGLRDQIAEEQKRRMKERRKQ